MLADSGLFHVDVLGMAIQTFQKPAIAEPNMKAVSVGAELVSKTEQPNRRRETG